MAKPLSILFVASEVYPFAKVGGVADVAYSLPLALRDLGHDVRVMFPKYGSVSERKNRIHEINRLKDIPIPLGDEEYPATVKSSSMNNPRTKVQAYITTNENFFDSKKGIYRDPKTWEEYEDNADRFAYFNRSVIETCMILGWYPDVIHINDWPAGLIPAYVKLKFPKEFKKTKIVLTIHNFGEQGHGNFKFEKTGLPEEAKSNYRFKNKFNFLKGAIYYSDYITTVSETYADQMLNDRDHGNGLSVRLKEKADVFKGILNGIDPWNWNPETDPYLENKLSGDFENFKYNNKVAVVNAFELEFKPLTPLISFIARLDEQKGIDLVLKAADKLLNEDVQMVVLARGEEKYQKALKKLVKKYPEKIAVKFEQDNPLAHLIEAGSDIFLMPSKYEPCGLNLMYSHRYGTIPVVHETGGIKDIAIEYSDENIEGDTFVFRNYDPEELFAAIKRATDLFRDEEKWEKIIRNCRNRDHTWKQSAPKYVEIYKELMKD